MIYSFENRPESIATSHPQLRDMEYPTLIHKQIEIIYMLGGKAVCNIDSSQEVAFEYKRLLNDTFVSHHITKEGVLTITYNEKVDNTTDPNDITVKSMEWSELPILEQDLPK